MPRGLHSRSKLPTCLHRTNLLKLLPILKVIFYKTVGFTSVAAC